MKEFVDKLVEVEKAISQENGEFELFTLLLREDSPNKWDLIVSSDWARSDKKVAIDRIIGEIRKRISSEEMLLLSRMVVLEKDHPAIEAFHRAIKVEHSIAKIKDSNFFGMPIKHAFLITSKRLDI